MLTFYLALGLIGGAAGASDVTTPAERVITVSRSSGFTSAAHSLDPYDRLDYELNLAPLLETGEQFETIAIAVLPSATLLGFSIPTTGEYAAALVSNARVRIWPQIAEAQQNADVWNGTGTACALEVSAITNSEPPRLWQRTLRVPVAQK